MDSSSRNALFSSASVNSLRYGLPVITAVLPALDFRFLPFFGVVNETYGTVVMSSGNVMVELFKLSSDVLRAPALSPRCSWPGHGLVAVFIATNFGIVRNHD